VGVNRTGCSSYTGKFTIDGDKLTTNVDLSWNEILTGTAQVRFFNLGETHSPFEPPNRPAQSTPVRRW
jgi:hypothetical protein